MLVCQSKKKKKKSIIFGYFFESRHNAEVFLQTTMHICLYATFVKFVHIMLHVEHQK